MASRDSELSAFVDARGPALMRTASLLVLEGADDVLVEALSRALRRWREANRDDDVERPTIEQQIDGGLDVGVHGVDGHTRLGCVLRDQARRLLHRLDGGDAFEPLRESDGEDSDSRIEIECRASRTRALDRLPKHRLRTRGIRLEERRGTDAALHVEKGIGQVPESVNVQRAAFEKIVRRCLLNQHPPRHEFGIERHDLFEDRERSTLYL